MIKYFIICLLFICQISFAQTLPSGFPTQANNGWTKWGFVQADKGLIWPMKPTNSYSPRYTGTTLLDSITRKPYYYDSTTLTWYRFITTSDDTSSFGKNISNASLTANGTYSQNWNNKQLVFDSIGSPFQIRGGGIGSTGTRRKEFLLTWNTSFANQLDAWKLVSSVRNAASTADSIYCGIMSAGTGVLSAGVYNTALGNNFISYNTSGLINISAKDSIWIKGAEAAATADSILGLEVRSNGISKLKKIPLPTGASLSNIGAGYRWVATAGGNIKTLNVGYGTLADSTSVLNTLTLKSDTNSINGLITRTDEYINSIYDSGLVVFYDDFKRSSIGSNYTTAFPATTVSIDNSGLTLSGTPGNYVNYISRNWYTCASNYIEKVRYVNLKFGATSYGLGNGIRSSNAFGFPHNVLGGVYQTSGNIGKSYLVGGDSYGTTITGSGAIPAISVSDTIEVVLIRTGWTYTTITTNLTTGQTSTITQATTSSGSPFPANNTGKPTIYFLGDSIKIIGWEYRILDRYNADYCFVGNSITFGQAATSIDSTFANMSFANDAGVYSINNAGGADYTQSVLDRLEEFYFLKPRTVNLMIGGNDILFGVSSGTWQANLKSIRDSLVAHNINVIHLAPTPRNSTNVKPLRDYISSEIDFTNDVKILKTFDSLVSTGTSLNNIYDAGDGVHLNNLGHSYVASLIRGNVTVERRIPIPTIPLNALIASGYELPNAVLTNHGWENIITSSGGGGSTTIGTIDSQTPSSNGAIILGSTLYMQSASATNPGLVNISTQTFSGIKTYTDGIIISKTSGLGEDYKILNPAPAANFALNQFYPNTGTNVNMSMQVVPKGTGNGTNKAQISVFNTDYIADGSNYEAVSFRATGTTYDLTSEKIGTATVRPIRIFTEGNPTQLTLNISGEVQIGSATDQGSFTLQNTGGFYQNGTSHFRGVLTAPSTYTVFVHGVDSNQYQVPASTFSTPSTTGTQIHDSLTANNVSYGTYTPTLTNSSNISASTAYQCQYMRVGNVVTVSGKVDIDPTSATTLTILGISLPIASALGNDFECGGTGVSATPNTAGAIKADATSDRAQLDFTSSTDVASRSWFFSFTYLVTAP